MTNLPNEVRHNHTHVERTGKLHSMIFFGNIDIQRSKAELMFSEKIITSLMFRPEYIQ